MLLKKLFFGDFFVRNYLFLNVNNEILTAMKILFFDLDDTLLHSDKTISEYTLKTLKECQARGLLVAFATSRGQMRKSPFAEKVQPDIIVANGGASVLYKGKTIYSVSFTLDETRRMLSKAYEICGSSCEITLDTEDVIYWNRQEDKSTNYSFNAEYDDFTDFAQPALKICVQTWDESFATQIASSVPGSVAIRFSDIPWYKFSRGKATKENAIQFLSEHLNVPLSEMAAFGDDFSDIGMLKMCGTGVAMGNAIPEVKAAADYVTLTNNDDGAAHFIRERIL